MLIKIKKEILNTLLLIIIFSTLLSLVLTSVNADPIGPTVNVLSNTTKNTTAATEVNTTINGTISPGGYTFTLDLTSIQKNSRWKAYVGNVTGTLLLDDANDNTLFQWTLSTVTGEVYATRASANVNWSGINCTWIADSKTYSTRLTSNRTPEHNENLVMSHTNKDDNITATFDKTNHSSIEIGGVNIGKDECYSVQTWQKDAQQAFSDSENANFTQVILYDGALGKTNGNVIYATEMEDDVTGYRSDSTYDFQMILPEVGLATWTSSTAYYFYVELA